MPRRAVLTAAVVWFLVSSPGPAAAQRPGPGEAQQPIPLPEQKVTAPAPSPYVVPNDSRTGTPLHERPESITVVPRTILDEQKAFTLRDVLRNVAGVAQNAGRGFNDDLLIRGFRPAEGSLILRDQFPQAIDDLSAPAELWNVDRVEVLKGPKAFLYGRSEPGGVVNLVTKRPLAQPSYVGQLDIGSFDLFRGAVDLTGPVGGGLGDRALYRFNGLFQDSASFRDVVTGTRYLVAPALTVKLAPGTEITGQFEHVHHDRTRDTGIVAIGRRPAPVPISTFLNDRQDRIEADTYRAGYELTHALTEDWHLRHAFQYLRLTGSFVGTSVGAPDAAGNATRSLGGFDDILNEGFAVQNDVRGRLTTGPFEHRAFAGIELSRNLFDGAFVNAVAAVPRINIFAPAHRQPLPGVRPVVAWSITHDALGVYAQDDVRLTSAWRILGGLRADFVRQRDVNPVDDSLRRDQDFSHVTPRAGVVFQPIAPLALYASYSESFQPVGGSNPDGGTFDPMTGRGWELGGKLDPFQGRVVTTLALYHITKDNVTNPDPVRPSFQVQTGEERSRGIELDVAGTILPGWDVLVSYAYTDAIVSADTNVTRVGKGKAGVPEHAASLWTRYTFQDGIWQGFSLGLGLFHVGERPGDILNSYQLPDYLRVDALIAYRFKQFQASLNFNNVTDTVHYVSGGSRTSIFPGEPFNVVGSLGVRF